jgi:hypothetical protein
MRSIVMSKLGFKGLNEESGFGSRRDQTIFLFFTETGTGDHADSYEVRTRTLFPGMKRMGRETTSGTELMELYHHSPIMS